jgi:hypothetical protein
MKRSLLILLIAPIFFFSCKKESKNMPAKKYAVNVNVMNFTQKQTTFALRHTSDHLASDTLTNLNSYIDLLYYVVLDQNFNTVKTKLQDSTMNNLGAITDSLAAGTYYIALVAGKKGLEFTPTPGLGGYYDYSGKGWQDTFWASFTLIVGDSNISRSVTLTRAVGKLEVQIADNMPSNADSLYITVDGDAIQKNILDSSFFVTHSITFPVYIPASAKGNPNFTVDRLIGGISQSFHVTLTCKDAGGSVINTVTTDPIYCYANKKTVLSGDLFSVTTSSSPQSFTVKVDTAWSSTTNQQSFSLRLH